MSLHTGTTKYSVKGDDYFSLVKVNFAGGIYYIKCHSGFCAAANMDKKRMPRSAKLNKSAKLCSHLQTCCANIDTITRDFSSHFRWFSNRLDLRFSKISEMHQKYHPRYPVKREFGNLPKCITNQSEIPLCIVIIVIVNWRLNCLPGVLSWDLGL